MYRDPHNHIRPLARPFRYVHDSARIGIVLLHGFADTPYSMKPLAQYLSSLGYTVHVPRLPGHGSRLSDLAKTKLEDWQQGVRRAIDGMHQDVPKVVVIARSFSGVLSYLELSNGGTAIDGLITIGTPHRIHGQRFLSAILPVVRLVRRYVLKPWAKKEDAVEREETGRYRKFPTNALREFFRAMRSVTPDRLRNVHVPVLMIQGQKDELSPSQSPSYYLEHLGGAEKKLVWIRDVSHNAHALHSHPLVRQSIRTFLEDRSKEY